MEPRDRAATLVEALPYIQQFAGKTIVVKYGGAAQVQPALHAPFAQDIVLLKYVGINVVVVHGGGPQIGETLKKIGKTSEFVEGLRVTDEETVGVVEMVLSGATNKSIVRLINRHGGNAVGLSGSDAGLTTAKKLIMSRKGPGGEDVEYDLGRVGEVLAIKPDIIHHLTDGGFHSRHRAPGRGTGRQRLQHQRRLGRRRHRRALHAEKFILLTDVPGILDDDEKPHQHHQAR